MSKNDLFFDSSALLSGLISPNGAARALLLLAEDEKIVITVSEQMIAEVERNLARKVPAVLPFVREMILQARIRIRRDPEFSEVKACLGWIAHANDAPILAAAVQSRTDFLVTLNTRHFIDDPEVSRRSGLRIGTPGDALGWIREQWTERG
ncbi:MAG: putative toxin-antitoxin system toxin component, PIN family [Anaerolineae bacterium]|nr:putative toxin-antitoxin system toxin component, PIN family [Anaerolineae bacterium]